MGHGMCRGQTWLRSGCLARSGAVPSLVPVLFFSLLSLRRPENRSWIGSYRAALVFCQNTCFHFSEIKTIDKRRVCVYFLPLGLARAVWLSGMSQGTLPSWGLSVNSSGVQRSEGLARSPFRGEK